MDIDTAQKLNAATNRFYEEAAFSFSATREEPWHGWDRIAVTIKEHVLAGDPRCSLSALDLGCGNMRFERFLGTSLPDAHIHVHAIDRCAVLAGASERQLPANVQLSFRQMDIMQALEQNSLASCLRSTPYDIAVAFGFMHHIPLASWRVSALQTLIDHAAKGGIIAMSFWNFLKDPRLSKRALQATRRGCAKFDIVLEDPHDMFLGWQGRSDLYRYCHCFTDDEVCDIASAVSGAHLIDLFSADGKHALNTYAVFQRL